MSKAIKTVKNITGADKYDYHQQTSYFINLLSTFLTLQLLVPKGSHYL